MIEVRENLVTGAGCREKPLPSPIGSTSSREGFAHSVDRFAGQNMFHAVF